LEHRPRLQPLAHRWRVHPEQRTIGVAMRGAPGGVAFLDVLPRAERTPELPVANGGHFRREARRADGDRIDRAKHQGRADAGAKVRYRAPTLASCASITDRIWSNGCAPAILAVPMRNVGVEFTPDSVARSMSA